MTAQTSDTLLIDGYQRDIRGEPLLPWLARRKNKGLRFRQRNTACWRGYEAAWQVFNGRLFLTEITGRFSDGTPVAIESLFKNYSAQFFESVKAHHPANAGPGQFAFWMNGWIACSIGKLLHYEHCGYESVYERTLLLCIMDGFVMGQRLLDHTPPPVLQSDDEWMLERELARKRRLAAIVARSAAISKSSE